MADVTSSRSWTLLTFEERHARAEGLTVRFKKGDPVYWGTQKYTVIEVLPEHHGGSYVVCCGILAQRRCCEVLTERELCKDSLGHTGKPCVFCGCPDWTETIQEEKNESA